MHPFLRSRTGRRLCARGAGVRGAAVCRGPRDVLLGVLPRRAIFARHAELAAGRIGADRARRRRNAVRPSAADRRLLAFALHRSRSRHDIGPAVARPRSARCDQPAIRPGGLTVLHVTMKRRNIGLALRNVSHVVWNRIAKFQRRTAHTTRRAMKGVRETAKDVRASASGTVDAGKDAGSHVYASTVRTTRYWRRVQQQTIPRIAREISVRRELRAAARGNGPIIVGPWLGEVGYEVLYWVPFLRWFCDRYHVQPSRLVVLSRGEAASWYRDLSMRYIELLDLFTVGEFAARNAERQQAGDQKQQHVAGFDHDILNRVRQQSG